MSTNTPDEQPVYPAFVAESLRIIRHPLIQRLDAEFTVALPDPILQVFHHVADLANPERAGTVFDEIRGRDTYNDCRYFMNLVSMGVQEGLRGVYYHLKRFIEYEQYAKRRYREVMAVVGHQFRFPSAMGMRGQVLVFEFESFTLLSRATLDRLNNAFCYYFRQRTDNLFRTERHLSRNFASHPRAKALIATIAKHRAYLDTQIQSDRRLKRTERDTLAHFEYVPFGQVINVQLNQPSADPVRVSLAYPGMDFTKDAGDELNERFDALAALTGETLTTFLDAPAPAGTAPE